MDRCLLLELLEHLGHQPCVPFQAGGTAALQPIHKEVAQHACGHLHITTSSFPRPSTVIGARWRGRERWDFLRAAKLGLRL